MAKMAAMGGLPRSRRYLAVPFVGKDAPSHAAEFAHPDVAIGLTILGYRYEGMRQQDFGPALRLLRQVGHHTFTAGKPNYLQTGAQPCAY